MDSGGRSVILIVSVFHVISARISDREETVSQAACRKIWKGKGIIRRS